AAREAQDVAALYPRGRAVASGDSTRSQLLTALCHSDVVHFAGHAVLNDHQPFRSELVTSGPRGTTVLDLSDLGWQPAGLVVPGSCSAAGGAIGAQAGPIDIAAGLIASGVESVIAASGDVDDRVTRDLLVRFHGEFVAGKDPLQALRTAQLALAT